MLEKFNKPYNSKEVEEKIYKSWEDSGYFNPDNLPFSKTKNQKPKTFSIIMPPPNANGSLHLGHALAIGLEDVIIRYKRMRGFKTLWIPGADHAGFETQIVYDKVIEKEGRNRFEIPREKLFQEILDFTNKNKKIMESQVRRLGASCDWKREKFTLDSDIISKTQDAFIDLYQKGMIYRGTRLVHWCPKHQTGFSDLEIDHEERRDSLYYIKYGSIIVATVRPETIFGDTAVAVNPKDKRYKSLIGKEIEVDVVISKLKLKIIADKIVDPQFGTGAVKITPAHDFNDYETWQRHKNEIDGPREVINKYGKMDLVRHFPESIEAKKYEGLKVLEARKLIVEDLVKNGLMEKIDETYQHNIARCYKCNTAIEPKLMSQWFVKMEPLAKPAINAVKAGKIKFIPERFKKIYFHWLKNIRDWNISRQIVWGIQIPAWQCQDCSFWIINKSNPIKCPQCGSGKVEQDKDVFDTWFSSGQWPPLTLGYPDGADYKNFYPTDVMETGWDILFFWVARMIMLGLYRTKKIPFKYVYLHGLVRDQFKQKMSKSKGNVINPIDMVEKYGSDALRMALIIGNTPGTDSAFSEEKIRGYRNFANKIWQASRFVLINLENFDFKSKPKLSAADKKKLNELVKIKKDISKLMESFKFYAASEKIYHYFWHVFCDKIIEEIKPHLIGKDEQSKRSAQYVLSEILKESVKILHPFMPFITEEIYQSLPNKEKELLMIENY